LVPDVKTDGFWMVTDTYSTTDVSIITWSGQDRHVQMGFDVDVAPAGEIGPSGEFYKGALGDEWHRDESKVCYITFHPVPQLPIPLLTRRLTAS
jgi:hypothetical protein